MPPTMRSLALVGPLGVVAACGSLDQPERTVPPPSAGIAPYRQVARIDVCQRGARLVASVAASGEQGVCRPQGRAARSCGSHAQCGPREACVCGRCTALLCRANRDCPQGLLCTGTNPARCARRCEAAVDCPGGSVCAEGVCTNACRAAEDCGEGELCLRGHCGVIACGPNGPNCGSGEACDLAIVEGRLRAPGAVVQDGVTVLYGELEGSPSGDGILRAESHDGLRFDAVPPDPVVVPRAGQSRVGAPSPLVNGAGLLLFYEVGDGAGIARTASDDGRTFGEPRLVLSPAAAWERGAVKAPGAVAIGSAELLFYEGGAGSGIGLAIAEGAGSFARVSEVPLLTAERVETPPHWTALQSLGAPSALVVRDALGENALRLFFSAVGHESTAPESDGGAPVNASIGLAAARLGASPRDLDFALFPQNPVLGGVQNLAAVTEREPSVVRVGDEWRLYFDDGAGAVWLATNPPR